MEAPAVSPACPTAPPRVLALDGLRGMACLLVLSYHYGTVLEVEGAPPLLRLLGRCTALNWCGVNLFFVLSGYLLGGICLRHRDAPHYFRAFYARRLCRVVPLYYLWIILGLALPPLLGATVGDRLGAA